MEQEYRARLIEKLADSLEGPVQGGTRRRLFHRPSLAGKATAVVGMRRAGKTTFLHQIRQDRLSQGWARTRVPYLNFEDERLAGVPSSMLHLLIDEFYRRHPELRLRESVAWCFDEIQVVNGWERFVRRILDEEKVELYLSGSSAAMLSREIATAMRGRAWELVLYPFSFREYLEHHQQAVPADPSFLSAVQRSNLERQFLDYLEVGGFPEAQGLDRATRSRLLTDYVDVATFRDVAERHAVSNLAGLRWLVRHLLGNAAGSFSVEKFHRSLKSQGFSIARDTLHQLLAHLEDCFLVRTVWVEASSERQRMVHPRKTYPIDPGLIPIFDRSGKANIGHALETAILLELERRGKSLTYVKTPEGYEVDFLARARAGDAELIQVCADPTGPVLERELRALAGVNPTRGRKVHRRLLTLTADALPDSVPRGVIAQPAYEWMLEENPQF